MKNLPRLGLGGGALGRMSDDDAFALLDAAKDAGVGLVDVAKSYGDAEARVGRWRKARGDNDLVVVTKGGYGPFDSANDAAADWSAAADWTGAGVTAAIDDAVARCGRVDVFLLHSCGADVLRRDDVGEALRAALQRGQVGAIGYSGDNDALHTALDRAREWHLSVVEASLSLLDGKARVHALPRARALGLQVIAKRALANAPWVERGADIADDLRWQRDRFLRAALPDTGLPLAELFLRFAAHTAGTDSILIGASRAESLLQAVFLIAKGPLPDDVITALAEALHRCDQDSPT